MQLEEAEKRLQDSESKLARLRGVVSSKNNEVNGTKSVKVEKRSISPVSSKQPQSKAEPDNGTKRVKVERRSTSPVHVTDGPSRKQLQSKPELLIPAVTPKVSQPVISASTKSSRSSASPAQVSSLVSNHSNDAVKEKGDKTLRISSDCEIVQKQEKGTKRKLGKYSLFIGLIVLVLRYFVHNFLSRFELYLLSCSFFLSFLFHNSFLFNFISECKEHKELIPLVRTSSRPCIIRCDTSNHISSQHKRKLRSLALCPVNDQLFVTR